MDGRLVCHGWPDMLFFTKLSGNRKPTAEGSRAFSVGLEGSVCSLTVFGAERPEKKSPPHVPGPHWTAASFSPPGFPFSPALQHAVFLCLIFLAAFFSLISESEILLLDCVCYSFSF